MMFVLTIIKDGCRCTRSSWWPFEQLFSLSYNCTSSCCSIHRYVWFHFTVRCVQMAKDKIQ